MFQEWKKTEVSHTHTQTTKNTEINYLVIKNPYVNCCFATVPKNT